MRGRQIQGQIERERETDKDTQRGEKGGTDKLTEGNKQSRTHTHRGRQRCSERGRRQTLA